MGQSQDKDKPKTEKSGLVDKSEEAAAVRKHEKEFKGPIDNRSCTDVICCLIFVICIVALFGLSIWAFVYGDYRKIVYPTNSEGQLCGIQVKDRPKLYFFDLLQCMKASAIATGCLTPQVCVKKCPDYYWNWLQAVAEEEIAKNTGNQEGVKKIRREMICLNGKNGLDDEYASMTISDLVTKKKCAPYVLKSTSVLDRCTPSAIKDLANMHMRNEQNATLNATEAGKGSNTLSKFLAGSQVAQNMLQDMIKSWHLILVMLSIAVLVSLLWVVLLRFLAGIIVWITLLLFIVMFSVATGYSFYKYAVLSQQQKEWNNVKMSTSIQYYMNLKETWLGFGITAGLILLIILIMLIFLRNRIRIAIALIGEASSAIGYMMCSLIWPFIPFLMQLVVFFYFILLAVYLTTVGKPTGIRMENITDNITSSLEAAKEQIKDICDPTQNDTTGKICQFVKYEAKQYLLALQFYNLFMFFWLVNFVIALGQMTLAGAFASYYFAFTKPKDIPTFPLLSSFWRCLRYHLGTLAFGSLLIALCQLVRAILEYIDQKTKESQTSFMKFVMKCMKCCLWCLEKFLKFLNKNAYIMTAIYGQNFCTAAKNAFSLILRNIVRVFVVDKVTDFVLFIGKLFVVGAVGSLAFFFFDGTIGQKSSEVSSFTPKLHYYFVPVIIIVIGTYVIASLFFSVYSMAVDTLFLCFLEDLERNDGSPDKPYYMSKGLMEILGKKNESEASETKKESEM